MQEEMIRGYCSSLRNCSSEKETFPILSQIRTFLESDLDELPARCAIAESCGIVSVLSVIVSSHSSIGLRSIASSLISLIQNALGSCEVQKTEHSHYPSHQNISMIPKPINDMKEEFNELRTTMCAMATQMAEQHGRMNSWMMKYDSILNHLDDKRKSDLLHQSRFQRWSKTGADAIEIFDEDFFIKTDNTFTLRQRPENEKTNFIPKTLFSPIITSDVAQLSFTITHSNFGFRSGAVKPHLIDTGTKEDIWEEKHGGACWAYDSRHPAVLQANAAPPQRRTYQIVLEADCRDERQTLKTMENGKVNSNFSTNLSPPFRFVITLLNPSVSVTIHTLSFTAKPTLVGGEIENKFQP
ncbi:hypothetical protein BLNAU_13377 [Blattamonas nauphoetae]|uniref:Uncharacterized protein n=1 Tax=Blattamonas nauphoetae TaxID=2049346 RepID=A0ABQ9XGP4_9EUKA|nr:hypothetical protein BLNAU_13377 [Blattamonas nauphoetae]